MNNVFSTFRKVDEELLEELEEALIMSDIGMTTSVEIISRLRQRIKKENIKEVEEVKEALRQEMQNILEVCDNTLKLETKPSVILIVGVNGVRKDNVNREDCKQTSKRRQKSNGCSSGYIQSSSSRTARNMGKTSKL